MASSNVVVSVDDCTLVPLDDEDGDVFFDDLGIGAGSTLSPLAFGPNNGVHLNPRKRKAPSFWLEALGCAGRI